jgi:8-oxo-dGTP diphosphatase
VREWLVASGIIEGPDGLLLVQNRRRNGSLDWSTPGGVIEVADGETVLDGLTREVEEETGIRVTAWEGPLYEVHAEAEGMGWRLRVEVHRALDFAGDLVLEDLDEIVVDAQWVDAGACGPHLEACPVWVREPLAAYLAERWSGTEPPSFRYRVEGADRAAMTVVRL